MSLLQKYPLLLPVFSFLGGLLTGADFPLGGWWGFLPWVGTGATGGLLIWNRRSPWARTLLLIIFFFSLGVLRIGDRFHSPLASPLQEWVQTRKEVPILIRASGYCEARGKVSRFPGELLGWYEGKAWRPFHEKILVTVGSPRCPAVPGGFYRSLAHFNRPRAFGNPSRWNYPRHLRAQKIRVTVFVKEATYLVPLSNKNSWLPRLRDHWLERIRRNVRGPEAQGILEALFLREKRSLSREVEEGFRRSGLSHILVVSGLHLGLVYGWFFGLFYFLGSGSFRFLEAGWTRKVAWLGALIPTVLYAGVVGFSPSVLRALGMVGLGVMGGLIQLRKDGISLVLLTAFVLLMVVPGLLYDLSFQFSFIAVTAIILMGRSMSRAKWVEPWIPRGPLGRLLSFFAKLMLITIGVNLALFPWVVYSFHRVSLVAPLANLIGIPVFTFLILPGLLVAVFLEGVWPAGGGFFLWALGELTQGTFYIIRFLSDWPGASPWVVSPSFLGWVAYGLGMVVFLSWHQARRVLFCILGIFLTLGLGILLPGNRPPGTMALSSLDVGQGESLVLDLPDGKVIWIDGGGFPYSDFDVGERILVPEFLFRRIPKIRAVVLTHPDADHLRGLTALVENFEVEEFWVGSPSWELKGWEKLKEILRLKKIPVRLLHAGNRWAESGVDIQVLWPPGRLSVASRSLNLSRNDRSLVLRVCFKKVCYLMTGDLEEPGEKEILKGTGPSAKPSCRVEPLSRRRKDLGSTWARRAQRGLTGTDVAWWAGAFGPESPKLQREIILKEFCRGFRGRSLQSDVLKVGHHGSRTSTSLSFLDRVRPQWAIISAGAGNRFGFPHEEVLKRLKAKGVNILRTDQQGQVWIRTNGEKIRHGAFTSEPIPNR